ncbi:MAG: hypothetical protein ACR2NB_12035 [Solirubrobacteraceae bacterium]
MKTLSISPKLIAPVLTALGAVATSAIVTGGFNRAELAALAVTLIGAVGGYLAPPAPVVDSAPDLYDPALDEPNADVITPEPNGDHTHLADPA